MSFFNKMLASVGIGNAQVDTRLEKSSYEPGEWVRGVVHIKGGSVQQSVDRIYIKVMTEYIREHDDRKHHENCEIARFNVSDRMTVLPNETREIPFQFALPMNTPLTLSGIPVWFHTGLDIESAVDPTDRDRINVTPDAAANAVLQAVEGLGFRFKASTCEYHPRLGQGVPFVQELEFWPGGGYAGRVQELELIFHRRSDGISVLVEVDRRGRGLSGWLERSMDMDERQGWLHFGIHDLQQGPQHIAGQLHGIIDYFSR